MSAGVCMCMCVCGCVWVCVLACVHAYVFVFVYMCATYARHCAYVYAKVCKADTHTCVRVSEGAK